MNWDTIDLQTSPRCARCNNSIPKRPLVECEACGHGWLDERAVAMHDYVIRSKYDEKERGTPMRTVPDIERCPCCMVRWPAE